MRFDTLDTIKADIESDVTFPQHVGHRSGSVMQKSSRQRPGNFECGKWDNYRTIVEDFEAVYLFGIQVIEA